MALVNFDFTGAYSIDQGYEWRINVFYPGNVLGAGLRGEIRDGYGGDLLTAFRFDSQRFDAALNRTQCPIYLARNQTNQLPLTPGRLLVYDIRIALAGRDSRLLMAGKLQVNPTLTQP